MNAPSGSYFLLTNEVIVANNEVLGESHFHDCGTWVKIVEHDLNPAICSSWTLSVCRQIAPDSVEALQPQEIIVVVFGIR